MRSRLRLYYRMVKPGIIYGNLLTVAAGYLLASKWQIAAATFGAVLAGSALVMASGCVFNNYIDRNIDRKMARTQKRALVTGQISGRAALTYGTLLGLLGLGVLAVWVNGLVVVIGLVAWISYVILYGWAKRNSVHGTLVGTIPGATPPVAGYCAATGHLDAGAGLLFLILVCWQMPHFYAIAMYRLKDYQAAGIPVMPAVNGMYVTKIQIMGYIIAYIIAAAALTVFGYAGWIFALITAGLGIMWLQRGIQGFKTVDDAAWARKAFGFSLVVLLSFSITLSVGSVLP